MTTLDQVSDFSVAIPVYNGAETLPILLQSRQKQSVQPVELLISDSGSTDASVEIAQSFGGHVIHVEKEDFDHGGTRSLLAQQAKTEIVMFFTQDAVLTKNDDVKNLLEPLHQNPTICCSYGRQLPNSNATLFSSHLREFNYPQKSTIRQFRDNAKLGLKTVFLSNSFAAYKIKYLKEVGYFSDGLIFGEDTCTLGKLLLAGHKVAYVSESAVYHSHNYTYLEEFRRSFDNGVLHAKEKWLVETYGKAERIGTRYVQSALMLFIKRKRFFGFVDCSIRILLKYIGYKMGRVHTSIPSKIIPFLSMNRWWWQQ